MATTAIDVQDLPSRFDEVVSAALAGAEVVVTAGGVPRAKLVPLPPPVQKRILGLHPGAFQIAPDFDDYLEIRPSSESASP